MKKLFLAILFTATMTLHAQEKIKVACIGDSITEGSGLPDSLSYPKQLQNLLGENFEVRNFGVGGRTLLKRGDFPYWQEEKYRTALSWKADIVIIKLGTNDSKPQNWIYSEEFTGNYKALIKSFRAVSKNILMCTPIPVFEDKWGITQVVVEGEIVPMVKEIAVAERVKLIDLHSGMQGKGDLVPDGVHPGAAGAAIIANVVFEALVQYQLVRH